MAKNWPIVVMVAAGLSCGSSQRAYGQAEVKADPRVTCAPDSVMNTLRSLLGSLQFSADSTDLEFVAQSAPPSDLPIKAKQIKDQRTCRHADSLYVHAADPAYGSTTLDRIVVARIGSFYFVYQNQEANVLLADRKWKVLTIMGFDND
jgi:hypothetical protein